MRCAALEAESEGPQVLTQNPSGIRQKPVQGATDRVLGLWGDLRGDPRHAMDLTCGQSVGKAYMPAGDVLRVP